MERRIAPPGTRELEDTLNALVGEGAASQAIFKSKQKALMFAAAVGFRSEARVPVEKRGEPIRYSVFQGAYDDGFINALAVAETKDLKILGDDREDERITIFEEYAHGGLIELKRIIDRPGNPLDQLLALVIDAKDAPAGPTGPAADLARLLGV
jgi:dnd system-associated protein 4